jgi:hypothetical protein
VLRSLSWFLSASFAGLFGLFCPVCRSAHSFLTFASFVIHSLSPHTGHRPHSFSCRHLAGVGAQDKPAIGLRKPAAHFIAGVAAAWRSVAEGQYYYQQWNEKPINSWFWV